MSLTETIKIDDLLSKIAEFLDIPDHAYEEAVLLYEEIGSHLGDDDSPLLEYSPEIFPQGSFRLGTVVRPLVHEDEYDIDLVCQLKIKKESTTQAKLKEKVGDRLKSRPDIEANLEEFRRCWRINYPNQFHMDILPVIPDVENTPTGILLTDKDLFRWQKSDPIAYADWFYERMKEDVEEKRAAFAKSSEAEIEEVPVWRIRTPLQRIVQLLKRHRDIFFEDDFDDRPTSIIITTLAGHAYDKRSEFAEALMHVVRHMSGHIEKRNGEWWIANPIHPGENFADKWNETPERQEKFAQWLVQAERDFAEAIESNSPAFAVKRLSPSLGTATLTYASMSLGIAESRSTELSKFSSPQVPGLSAADHCKPLRWTEQLTHRASIRGGVYHRLGGNKKLWELTNRTVPKNVGLRFRLETNVRTPYEVWWQVVNTGNEARLRNGLRGNFFRGDEGNQNVHWEGTEYVGTHWIEGFVVVDGVCVARTQRKYVRIR
jgi:hypothetical protein